jgi:TatD DNase family protein
MDRDALISRASDAGVSQMVCCGSCEDDWERVSVLAKKYPQIIPAFGLHPLYVSKRSDQWLAHLEAMLSRHPRAAVGEIGIDHTLEVRNDTEQCGVFTEQLQLAIGLKRPVSIHCRKAWLVLLSTLKTFAGVPYGGVVHSYSGSPELVAELLKYGLSISFSGSVTNEHNNRARRSAAIVPIDKLLVETDSPDLVPQGRVGMNEPSFLLDIISTISSVNGLPADLIAQKTFENGMSIFNQWFSQQEYS